MGYPFGGWQQPGVYGQPPYTGYGASQFSQPMSTQATPQIGGQNPFTMVPTIADVDKVVAQPGETKWIMVQNDPVLAVKTANTMGYASSEYYRLTKFDPTAMQAVGESKYLTAAQADEKIQAAVRAEVDRVMAQYQTAPTTPAKGAKAKEA